ncbi:hypothetical protein Tco_1214852 [Tanacetum coccineum]
MRFMLAPKSAREFSTAKGSIRHGSVKLPGSPSLWEGKGRLDDLEVKLSTADHGGARKGGSCVLILDLVVMAKVGASVGGILSSHSVAFPLREKLKNLNLDVSIVASVSLYVFGGVGGLALVLWEEDASSSKRFLLVMQGDDLIECINKAMAFLSVVASRFPPSNNQLKTSSNPRNQATIQDGRVTVQQVQRRKIQSYVGTGNRGIVTTSKGNVAVGPLRVVKCYNSEAQEAGQILDEEQLTFLSDPDISEAPVAYQTILQNSTFQTDDLDAYNSDCDDLSSAKAVLMANLSSCDPEVLSEVPYSNSYPNDMINQDVNEPLTAEIERYKERIAIFEQRLNVDLNQRDKLIDSQMDDLIRDRNAKLMAFQQEIDTLKETLSNNVKEKESLSKL